MIDTQTTLTYPHYKTTDQVWLGEIPKHWMLLANKYIFKLSKTQVGKNAPNYDLLSLTLKGVIKRNMVNPEGKFPAEFDTYQEVRRGDFIFCLFDVEETPRTVGLSDFEGMITGAYTVMHVNESFSKRFLFYLYFNLDVGKRLKFLYKGLRNTISKDSFFSFKIPIPPLPEQQAIAAYLDDKTAKIETAIAQKEKLIELLKERKQIVIQELVTGKKVWDEAKQAWVKPNETIDSGMEYIGKIPKGWKVKRLRYLGNTQNGISADSEYFGSGFPFLSYSDVYQNSQIPKGLKGLANSSINDRENYSVKENDIFFTRTSETKDDIGISSVCFQDIPNATFAGFLIRFRPYKNNTLYKGYSKFYFRSEIHKSYFTKEMNLVTRASLSQELLKAMPVVLPDFIEQKLISNEIQSQSTKIDRAISLQAQQIEKLKEYKQVLIDEVVRGKRRVC